jgi:protein ImuA
MNTKSYGSDYWAECTRIFKGLWMIAQLRQRLLALQRAPGIEDGPGILPFGIPIIDAVLGGGLMRAALHEIAAPGEAHLTVAMGFALGLASLSSSWPGLSRPSTSLAGRNREDVDARHKACARAGLRPDPSARHDGGNSILWIAEDMALAESGALHGASLDAFGLAPERLVMVSAAHRRDLFWAMEEALRCRAVDAVIGETRIGEIDSVAVRRLSLAAAESGALALLLRAVPPSDASTAATRWIVGAASTTNVIPGRERSERTRNPDANSEIASGFRVRAFGTARNDELRTHGPGAPRFATQLVRNRRGPVGSWILEWSDSDERFIPATHAQPVAAPALDRPHRQVA